MEEIQHYLPLISFILMIVLGLDRWGKARELKESNLKHEQETSVLKSENRMLMAAQKHDSDYSKMYETINRVETEMRFLRDKASERHGEIQGKIGTMELRLNEFIIKHTAQIDELYRNGLGRRASDNQDSRSN